MKKNRLFAIMPVILSGFVSFDSYAAEKNIVLNLEQEYETAVFSLEFEEDGAYTAVLTNGIQEYKFNVIDENTLECTINDCDSGNWKIIINDGNSESTEMCKVTASVKTKMSSETESVGNIKVAQEIAGLKAYMKDDSVVVSWEDQTCGDVIVKVQDIDTNRIIKEEKVKNNIFSCEVSDEVKNILVSCVPATSKGVQNAAMTFNLSTENNPQISVMYEDEYITNKTDYKVSVNTDNDYILDVLLNGENVLNNVTLVKGENDISIPLKKEGNNVVTLELERDNGYIKTFTHNVILDVTAPKFVLNNEYDGIDTYDESLLISGYVSNYRDLYVNDNAITDIKTDGYFEYILSLHDGENELFLKAIDDAGNETVYDLSIQKIEKKINLQFGNVIFYGVLGIGLIAAFIYKKKKQNLSNTEKNNSSIISPLNESVGDDSEEEVENTDEVKTKKEKHVKAIVPNLSKLAERIPVVEKELKHERRDNMKQEMASINKKLIVWVIAWFVCLLFFIKNIIIFDIVPTTSMAPTIEKNEHIIVNGLAYIGENSPERGDIVRFKSDEYDMNMVKRVIGVPGDVITFKNGNIYINDMLCNETAYLDSEVETNCMHMFTVPEGSYFLLGDNRENSNDSRFWNNPYITESEIKGKVISIYNYPWE